jgi:hypothetical protein
MIFRNSLILISAITAALAAPLAFAQSGHASATTLGHVATQATSPAMPATPSVPATPPTDDTMAAAATSATGDATATGATPATPATPAASAASAKRVNWSQLDSDKDGKLSKAEAAPVKGLSKVFDQADANKDGALTADEYKAYLAAHVQGSQGNSG